MSKYVCSVCGYVYNESVGDPGTKWEELPDDWACPLCGASKNEFEVPEENKKSKQVVNDNIQVENHDLTELSFGEMSAIFSNLAKGSEKQYRFKDAERFSTLAEFYNNISKSTKNKQLTDINEKVKHDIDDYAGAKSIVEERIDRGALRALVWSEKVTRILSSILSRYEKQKADLLKDKNIYVCEICGFVYIGDEPPGICPVCKVPRLKITKIQKEAI